LTIISLTIGQCSADSNEVYGPGGAKRLSVREFVVDTIAHTFRTRAGVDVAIPSGAEANQTTVWHVVPIDQEKWDQLAANHTYIEPGEDGDDDQYNYMFGTFDLVPDVVTGQS
jgi:hypothetical protein